MYSLIFILLCNGITACNSKSRKESHHKLLLISFDGFRHDYFDKVATPNFDSFAATGVKAEGLIPVFPSKTFPNHYSIVTGLYPEHTGLVGNTMYDPQWDQWYHISDRSAVQNGKWYGGEPIWNTLEKQGIRTAPFFWVGSEAAIEDIHPTFWKKYDESMPFRARIDTVVKWMSKPEGEGVDFATLYFSEPDHMGHLYGPQSDSVKAAVKVADGLIGYLKEKLQKANLWDGTNIIIVSDHGMTELSGDKLIVLDHIINSEDVKWVIRGPLTMIQPKKGKKEKVYQSLKSHEDHYRLYKRENIPTRYHLKENRRVADIIVVADLGYTILNEKYTGKFLKSLPAGTHGYDNNEMDMHGIFLAHGPDFKNGITVDPFQNIHIYDLLNDLMHTKPAPNDGSLDSVRVLLN
ncbi:MAG: ectonucleotide pyrophosphatase/phosphodiesterase [Balneolaceae bacterium]